MAREIKIMALEDGKHFLLVGFDNNSLASFRWQLYIHKFGKRAIDWCQAIGMNFITFMAGDVWIHNSDTAPRANLFGEQKEVKMGVVINEESNSLKLLDSLGVHADGQWEVESIVIPPTLNTPNGMYSKIPKERFKKRNGVWQAEFLRNMKSTSDTASVKEAISGEPLKGYAAYMILKSVGNPSGEQVKLFKINANMTKLRM